MSVIDPLRLPARAALFAGSTAAMYTAFEAHAAVAGAASRDEILRKWVVQYGRVQLKIFGFNVHGQGPHLSEGHAYPGRNAQGKGRLFVMNHRSALDILVALAFLDARIVSRGDLAKWPVVGYLAKRIGTLFVDRESTVSGARVAGAMVKAVEAGRGVLVFPEGTTFSGDEVRPFRPGAFVVAKRTGAELVPVGIAYADEHATFGNETFGAHMKRVAGEPKTRAALVVGEPIPVADRDAPALQAEAHAQIQSLVYTARKSL
ncbi:MAG: 1-acyl-sn-glycerol-3-phosphate acyltransferase [Polyangiaceae bacterium]|nr:1-acyl-sn-glycerol-3-phosphate acyltransferase [Polyangiaceae bacterium]